jgi:hypothetical protein
MEGQRMKTLDYNCCFCGNPGTVPYEEPECVPIDKFKKLLAVMPKSIACNPCAEFHRKKSYLARTIVERSVRWSRLAIDEAEPQERREVENRVRKVLSLLVNALCELYEKKLGLPPLFEPQMVESIMENPASSSNIINRIGKIARQKATL